VEKRQFAMRCGNIGVKAANLAGWLFRSVLTFGRELLREVAVCSG